MLDSALVWFGPLRYEFQLRTVNSSCNALMRGEGCEGEWQEGVGRRSGRKGCEGGVAGRGVKGEWQEGV